MAKIVIIIFLIAIIVSLGSGMFFLTRDTGSEKYTVRALTWRVAISIAMIIFLIVVYFAGWIHPHGIQP